MILFLPVLIDTKARRLKKENHRSFCRCCASYNINFLSSSISDSNNDDNSKVTYNFKSTSSSSSSNAAEARSDVLIVAKLLDLAFISSDPNSTLNPVT